MPSTSSPPLRSTRIGRCHPCKGSAHLVELALALALRAAVFAAVDPAVEDAYWVLAGSANRRAAWLRVRMLRLCRLHPEIRSAANLLDPRYRRHGRAEVAIDRRAIVVLDQRIAMLMRRHP